MTAAALCALALSSCGADDFPNHPRPASPIELGARIGDHGVSVSPREVGAGIANITISNQTSDAARLVLDGPNDLASDEVVPNGTGSLKVTLEEGDYEVSNGEDDNAFKLTVGPERESSQNDLGLP